MYGRIRLKHEELYLPNHNSPSKGCISSDDQGLLFEEVISPDNKLIFLLLTIVADCSDLYSAEK